ncbi:hypothetical protein RFI_33601, partial [Reticulomyxa filosa]
MQLQYWLIVVLLVSVASFVIGCFLPQNDKTGQLHGIKGWTNGNLMENMKPHYNVDSGIKYDFWQALALFFRKFFFQKKKNSKKKKKGLFFFLCVHYIYWNTAACTEILAGANIAMDLVDPGKNIPEGTFFE